MKTHSIYTCQQCGYKSSQYLGKCPQCDSWNSLVEEIEESQKSQRVIKSQSKTEIINLADIKQINFKRLTTKLEEVDRCLGGGIVLGSINLIYAPDATCIKHRKYTLCGR